MILAIPAQAAIFKFYWDADAQSVNTVKLIRNGYLYSGASPNVITMNWDATHTQYEAVLDDAAHVNDYWRIEDGTGNVVSDSFTLASKIIDADQVEDLFLRNDADDTKRGNLLIIPASGTTDVGLLIDNNAGQMVLTSTDTASVSTTGHSLKIQASGVDIETSGGGDISLTGIAQSATANSAVTRSNIDSLKSGGSGAGSWTNTMNLVTHETRLDALEGTGTFTAGDSLFLEGGGGQNILSFGWAFDPVGVNDSIDHVEIRYAPNPVPGYSQSGASSLSSGQINSIRSILYGVIYPERGNFTATLPSSGSYYVIVMAFDHTSPTKKVWGSNQVLITGNDNPIDAATPLIGTAGNLVDGVEQLANEVNDLKSQTGSSGLVKTLFVHENHAQAASVTLGDFYNVATAASTNIVVAFKKSSLWDGLRLTCQGRHSQGGGDKCNVALGCSGLTSSTTFLTTSATDATVELDCTSLADGQYYAYLTISDSDNNVNDTAYVYYPVIEAYNK